MQSTYNRQVRGGHLSVFAIPSQAIGTSRTRVVRGDRHRGTSFGRLGLGREVRC